MRKGRANKKNMVPAPMFFKGRADKKIADGPNRFLYCVCCFLMRLTEYFEIRRAARVFFWAVWGRNIECARSFRPRPPHPCSYKINRKCGRLLLALILQAIRNCGKKLTCQPLAQPSARLAQHCQAIRNCGNHHVPATCSAKRSATAEATCDAAASSSSPTNATSPNHARRSMCLPRGE